MAEEILTNVENVVAKMFRLGKVVCLLQTSEEECDDEDLEEVCGAVPRFVVRHQVEEALVVVAQILPFALEAVLEVVLREQLPVGLVCEKLERLLRDGPEPKKPLRLLEARGGNDLADRSLHPVVAGHGLF